MRVVSYIRGVPVKNNKPEKTEVLTRFIDGVNRTGQDLGISHPGTTYIPSDVAVIQGFVHENSGRAPHLHLRRTVLQQQKLNQKKTIIVDSNLFLYQEPTNRLKYLRFSMDGVFPTTGNYFDSIVDPNRWIKISKDLNLELKPWRSKGKHILLCCQRNGGWSMGGIDVASWVKSTVAELKHYTDRPIIVRAHPGDRMAKQYLANIGLTVSTNESIKQDLKDCHATVMYNSSPSVASVIEGIPTFITDPQPKKSQAYFVSNKRLQDIENPLMPERQQWIEKLCMSHWKFDELSDGSAWNHMRQFI